MIDGFRARRRPYNLHPEVKRMTNNIVVGGRPETSSRAPQAFKTPAEVAAAEEQKVPEPAPAAGTPTPDVSPSDIPQPGGGPPLKAPKGGWWGRLSKRNKIAVTALSVVLVSGAIIGAYFMFFSETPPPIVAKKETPAPPPAPTTVASNLTGLQVDPSVNERQVTAVMIENSVVARPQSGLLSAGVVFEAIAEGGITRFVALFQDDQPKYVGPVRSARPYYIQWMLGFDAGYAHAGGSAEALKRIKQWDVKDLPHHASYFQRISDRAAPHNLYTSIKDLQKYGQQKGYGKSEYTPLPRKDKETPEATPSVTKIDFNISSANFNVHYDYDAKTNSYKRSVGGAKHTDEKSGKQITPKVVVALIMPQGKNGIYYTYNTIGKGTVYVFQDGKVIKGTWRKKSNNDNFTFTDAAGDTLKLNPGQTWFTALGKSNLVKYK